MISKWPLCPSRRGVSPQSPKSAQDLTSPLTFTLCLESPLPHWLLLLILETGQSPTVPQMPLSPFSFSLPRNPFLWPFELLFLELPSCLSPFVHHRPFIFITFFHSYPLSPCLPISTFACLLKLLQLTLEQKDLNCSGPLMCGLFFIL